MKLNDEYDELREKKSKNQVQQHNALRRHGYLLVQAARRALRHATILSYELSANTMMR